MEKHELSRNVFQSQLKPRARLVLNCLIYHCNKNGECFPALKTIAAECGYGLTTVKRALNDLVDAGYITKQARFDERKHGGQTSNLYSVQAAPAPKQEQYKDNSVPMTPHVPADPGEAADALNERINAGDVSGLALSLENIRNELSGKNCASSHFNQIKFYMWPGEQAILVPP